MLIGLTGCKGAGKDTAAQWLIDEHGYTKMGFADQLKLAVANLFGCSMEEVEKFKGPNLFAEVPYCEVVLKHGTTEWSYTWREFLQRFGTEMGRETFGPDFWVDIWEHKYHDSQMTTSEYRPVVVNDVRFWNEAFRIHDLGGYIVEIKRPNHEPDGHASEEPLPYDLIDGTVTNDMNMDIFKSRFLATIEAVKVGITNA